MPTVVRPLLRKRLSPLTKPRQSCNIGSGMKELAERITVDPDQCRGRPCVRGMRIRVSDVLDLLANGLTREQVLTELSELELEDIHACLRFASQRLDHPVVAA